MSDSSPQWEDFDPRQKIMVVSEEIIKLIRELEQLTAPGGEVDLALEEASQSFDSLFNSGHFNIDTEENYMPIDSQLLDEVQESLVKEKSMLSTSNKSVEGKKKLDQRLADLFSSISSSIKDKNKERLDKSHQSLSGDSDLSEDGDRMSVQSNISPQVSEYEELPESKEEKSGNVNVKEKSVNSRKTLGTSVYESLSHYSTPTLKDQSSGKSKRSRRNTSDVF